VTKAKRARRPRSTRRVAKRRRRLPPAPRVVRGARFSSAPAVTVPPPTFPEIADPPKRAYLAQYALTGRFTDAAAAAGVSLRTGWNWRNDPEDAAFREALRVAQGLAGDRLEAEIARRAIDGVEEPVYQGGRLIGTVRRFSDTLLIFAAKGALPAKYRERVEHSGPKGGPIPLDHSGTVKFYLPDNGRGKRS
jgi:hypothetical protein